MKPGRISFVTGGFLVFLSWTLLAWGEFKINRVSRGITIRMMDVIPLYAWILMIVIFIASLWLEFYRPKIKQTVLLWILTIAPALCLIGLSEFIPSLTEFDPNVARVSLGIGFYLFLGGILLMVSKGKGGTARIVSTLVWVFVALGSGFTDALGLVREYNNLQDVFARELYRHLTLALLSACLAILPGVMLGYASLRYPKAKEWIFGFVHLFQVAPTLSLLALMMIPLTALSRAFPFLSDLGIKGIGFAPAFIVLFLYSLLPITSNTYAGLSQTDPFVLESATALGMTEKQKFRRIWFPLSLPAIFAGIRTAMTQNIGNTILAGLVGGGGMGALIFLGLSQSALDLVLLGTIPVVTMALLIDAIFAILEKTTIKRLGVKYDPHRTIG